MDPMLGTNRRGVPSVTQLAQGTPSKTYPEGRTCIVCTRPVSRYNPDPWCAGCYAGVPISERPSHTTRKQATACS
jgi:hypothetical protein